MVMAYKIPETIEEVADELERLNRKHEYIEDDLRKAARIVMAAQEFSGHKKYVGCDVEWWVGHLRARLYNLKGWAVASLEDYLEEEALDIVNLRRKLNQQSATKENGEE